LTSAALPPAPPLPPNCSAAKDATLAFLTLPPVPPPPPMLCAMMPGA